MANRFFASPGDPLAGSLVYSARDKGFSFTPASLTDLSQRLGGDGRTSLVADTLQLETSVKTGEVLFAWGYLPEESWRDAPLLLPDASPASVTVELEHPPLEEAISVSIARTEWKAQANRAAGLLRVVRADAEPRENLHEIAEGVFLGISETSLNSIWLRFQKIE